MRLFLDAHVSGRAIARALRERGHEVYAAEEARRLDGMEDDALLELATAEQRILVTFNICDFARIVGRWAGADKTHAGCLLIVGIDHGGFGLTLRVIDASLAARPEQEAWRNYAAWGTRAIGR